MISFFPFLTGTFDAPRFSLLFLILFLILFIKCYLIICEIKSFNYTTGIIMTLDLSMATFRINTRLHTWTTRKSMEDVSDIFIIL